MNPRDYYRQKTASITEADPPSKRLNSYGVCFPDIVGHASGNKADVGFHERQVRDILETLVIQYGWPVCAHAGKAGRWIATSEDDRWQVIGDLDSRIKSLRERREAMLTAKIPNALELDRQEARVMQTGLF